MLMGGLQLRITTYLILPHMSYASDTVFRVDWFKN